MSNEGHLVERAVREAAELMGLNPDRISPADRLRCELIAALRRVLDDQLAQITAANSTDLSKLVTAVETLTRFLAEAQPSAERPDEFEDDPHENLMRIIEDWVAADKANRADEAAERAERGLSPPVADLAAAQARIDELEARLAEFKPRALPPPAPEANAEAGHVVIDPPTSDIFGPREFADSDPGPRPGPDDHRVLRPKPVIDAKPEPAPQSNPSWLRPFRRRRLAARKPNGVVRPLTQSPSRLRLRVRLSSSNRNFGARMLTAASAIADSFSVATKVASGERGSIMSAVITTMHEFIETLSRHIPSIHPSARGWIDDWILDMRAAVNDPAEVVRLAIKVRKSVVEELRWEAEKVASVGYFKDAYRLRRQADRFESSHV
jgi:hypothetical protein